MADRRARHAPSACSRASGSRPTRQRVTVLSELMGEHDDVTAQELHERLRGARRAARARHRLPDARAPRGRGRHRRPLAPSGRALLPLVRRGPPPPSRLLELPPRRRARRLRARAVARADLRGARLRDHRPPPRGLRPLRRTAAEQAATSRLRSRADGARRARSRRRHSWARSLPRSLLLARTRRRPGRRPRAPRGSPRPGSRSRSSPTRSRAATGSLAASRRRSPSA